jgi:hypothetical protein
MTPPKEKALLGKGKAAEKKQECAPQKGGRKKKEERRRRGGLRRHNSIYSFPFSPVPPFSLPERERCGNDIIGKNGGREDTQCAPRSVGGERGRPSPQSRAHPRRRAPSEPSPPPEPLSCASSAKPKTEVKNLNNQGRSNNTQQGEIGAPSRRPESRSAPRPRRTRRFTMGRSRRFPRSRPSRHSTPKTLNG